MILSAELASKGLHGNSVAVYAKKDGAPLGAAALKSNSNWTRIVIDNYGPLDPVQQTGTVHHVAAVKLPHSDTESFGIACMGARKLYLLISILILSVGLNSYRNPYVFHHLPLKEMNRTLLQLLTKGFTCTHRAALRMAHLKTSHSERQRYPVNRLHVSLLANITPSLVPRLVKITSFRMPYNVMDPRISVQYLTMFLGIIQG